MSGRATRDAEQVVIGPAIWLICGSVWACKEISAAMKEITWPTLPMEIHEGNVPVPSVAEGQVDMQKLDLTDGYHFGDGITLYIHVEDSFTDTTSCGLLCCATIKDGDFYSHHFSRIGGLVTATNTLHSSQFGISTAHGVLDHPWWHKRFTKRSSTTKWDCQSVASADSQDEDDLGRDSLYDDQEGLYAESLIARDINPHTPFQFDNNATGEGYRDPQLVSRWRNVGRHGLLSFLEASITAENNFRFHNDPETLADHAMIQLESPQETGSRSWNNKYHPRKAPAEGSIDITTHMSNSDLTEGAVSIICEASSPLDGYLLPGSTCLAMSGRMFTLRKLKTATPLARGVSGSWVARGTALCGMVIAVANLEPYVYMMRAEDLISNLEASSSSIETIEVLNTQSRKPKCETDRTVLQRGDSRKSQRRPATAITYSEVSADEHLPITTIKRGLSTRLRGLGGSWSHGVAKNDFCPKLKPRRKRQMYSLLSDIFSTKVEEIIQSADRGTNDTKRISEVRRPSADSSRTLVTSESDGTRELEYIFLRSTTSAPAITFRHGPIRLHKLDFVSRQEANINMDSPEYDIALSRTARRWHSGNYEDQQERFVDTDEIEDLVDCDTTSEDSISSSHVWNMLPDLTAQACSSKCDYGYELKDIARGSGNVLSKGSVGKLSFEVMSELTGGPDFTGNSDEICRGEYAQGIMT
ncbi:hypothetical protein GQX73_g4030 [Xylaria multiplex]|uniref:Uncharacterized protein n=1 Tax=Xylaria multiplex TaxID=323545 RepID=A0A7C8MND7_9PEZI|nr:hypothetical protein GQX73_g4030 [Xylaria multiplex]